MRLAIAGALAALALLAPAVAQAAPTLSINDVSLTEGNSGQATMQFTVTTSETSPNPITVNYATADGSAKQPDDYTQTSGVLTIVPNTSSNTILVPIKGDTLDEPNETFEVNLSSAAGASITDSQGIGTITDDDGPPSISVNDVTRTETNGPLNFTVRLSKTSGTDVTVKFATADGSAHAPDDYTSTSGTLTIPAGQTSRTVPVTLREDALDEPTERFALNLSGATGATISDSSGRGTIADDDSAPSVSIRDTGVREGAVAGFLVVLSRATGRTVAVRWSTEAGTARAGVDFVTSSGTVTIPAGQTSGSLFVQVRQDTLDEPNETFRVRLTGATNARRSDSLGQATIVDDDPKPRPRLSNLRLSPFAFRAARLGGPTGTRGGTLVRYVLSKRAVVVFKVQRRRPNGRWATFPSDFRRTGHAGLNQIHFRGRIAGRRLAVGRYRLVVVARASGRVSLVRRAGFRIVA